MTSRPSWLSSQSLLPAQNTSRLVAAALSITGLTVSAVGPHAAHAQEAPATADESAAPAARAAPQIEEVVVTATRREASLQDVPLSITAVSGERLQDLSLFNFEDVSVLSPGLSLDKQPGFGSSASLRGVGFDSNSSASPAVDIYFNELPLDANYAFNSMFDVQQVEVLRGPQGTLRGRPAPAGAITLTTRRANLEEFGASGNLTVSDRIDLRKEVALNMPIVRDRLALRIAGVYDDNDSSGVFNVTRKQGEEDKTQSYRASLAWQPADALRLDLIHQDLELDFRNYLQVEGNGRGYNGPAISSGARQAVSDGGLVGRQDARVTTLNAQWDLPGHALIYVGGYQDLNTERRYDGDDTNAIADLDAEQYVSSSYKQKTHELRFQSDGRGGFADYSLGLWWQDIDVLATFAQPVYLSGAFDPAMADEPRGPANADYTTTVTGSIPVDTVNKAIFGSATFHVSDRTDLTLGARYVRENTTRSQVTAFDPASVLNAVPIMPGTTLTTPGCQAIGAGIGLPFERENYPGYCDLRIVLPSSTQTPPKFDDDAWVYNAAVTHRVLDTAMVYLNYGHSWRPPGITVAVAAPVPDELLFGTAEESDSYELGLKSEWLDRRVRVNVAVFHQKFDGYIGRFPGIPVLNTDTGQVEVADGFTYNADAVVTGAELDLTGLITENWSVQLTLATADGRFDDVAVPCRDSNFDGIADNGPTPSADQWAAPGPVAFCVSDDPISDLPRWNATLQSQLDIPFGTFNGYLRGLYSYTPEQRNDSAEFTRDSYGLLNVYAGARSQQAAGWDFSVWAKNVFDREVVLSRGSPGSYNGFSSGYNGVTYAPSREVGVTMRYAFGGG